MTTIALLLTATLFGGMMLFSFGFAMLMFKIFDKGEARRAIRESFPFYYKFVTATAVLSAASLVWVNAAAAGLMALVAASTVFAEHVLMHKINAATDAGNQSRFKWLHGGSVVLQLVQIAVVTWLLARFF